jgi:hypothetical protein
MGVFRLVRPEKKNSVSAVAGKLALLGNTGKICTFRTTLRTSGRVSVLWGGSKKKGFKLNDEDLVLP